jgi:hypothetical protein
VRKEKTIYKNNDELRQQYKDKDKDNNKDTATTTTAIKMRKRRRRTKEEGRGSFRVDRLLRKVSRGSSNAYGVDDGYEKEKR